MLEFSSFLLVLLICFFSIPSTDIPIYPGNSNNSKIQALHVLFSLYAEFKNSQHFQNLADKNDIDGSGNAIAEKLDLDKD